MTTGRIWLENPINDHFNTQIITRNCRTNANSHTLLLTTDHNKHFLVCCLHQPNGNGLQRCTFHFLWVSELLPVLAPASNINCSQQLNHISPLTDILTPLTSIIQSQNQSQSYVATDGQSVLSRSRDPSGAHENILVTVWQIRLLFVWGFLSDEGTCLSIVRGTVNSNKTATSMCIIFTAYMSLHGIAKRYVYGK
jgi:hypothetical protein